jgi:hypothetical protein
MPARPRLVSSLGLSLAVAAAAAGVPPAPATADLPTLEGVLRKAGQYVVEYGRAFSLVVAEEQSVQRLRVQPGGPVHQTRTLRSDVVFVLSPGTMLPWQLLRDVYEADGLAVRDRQRRLEGLLVGGDPDRVARARAVADESARFNLGRGVRNYNVPTLVLTFLHPDLQPRFAFERRRSVTVDGRTFVEIGFSERASPTVIRDDAADRDVPARGRVLVDPGSGTIARTQLSIEVTGDGAVTSSQLETTYRALPSLAMWVPVEMRERLESRGRSGPAEYVEGIASYGAFRRAVVQTQEEVKTPRP